MASIIITDDNGSTQTIDGVSDSTLISIFNLSRLAQHFKISPQLLAIRCCKQWQDGKENPYRSLVLAIQEPVRKYNKSK